MIYGENLKHEAKASFRLSTDMFISYATYTVPISYLYRTYTVPIPYLYLLDILAKTHSLVGRTRLHPTAGCLPTGIVSIRYEGRWFSLPAVKQ